MSPRVVPRAWGRFFHVLRGQPYHVANSLRGLVAAVAAGFKAIDWDVRVTKDGVIVVCHWPRPMLRDGFRAPKGSGLRRTRTVESMTWAQVKTLRTKDGYRIWRLDELLPEAALREVRVEIEAKDSPQLARVATWAPVAAQVKALGLSAQVKTLSDLGDAYGRLKAAKLAGFTTIMLARGPIPSRWYPAIDYVRGRWDRRS